MSEQTQCTRCGLLILASEDADEGQHISPHTCIERLKARLKALETPDLFWDWDAEEAPVCVELDAIASSAVALRDDDRPFVLRVAQARSLETAIYLILPDGEDGYSVERFTDVEAAQAAVRGSGAE